jgi:hypothetical protein
MENKKAKGNPLTAQTPLNRCHRKTGYFLHPYSRELLELLLADVELKPLDPENPHDAFRTEDVQNLLGSDAPDFFGLGAPAVLFRYSPDRKAIYPNQHLESFKGVLQADAYAGFNPLYERAHDPLLEAACWAHARRKFYDIYESTDSSIAREALERVLCWVAFINGSWRSSARSRESPSCLGRSDMLCRVGRR